MTPAPAYMRAKQSAVRTQKEFRVWDGEGITYDGRTDQSYVLFGYNQGDGRNRYLIRHQLSSRECLSLICDEYDREVINVGYGFTYDVDQILRDLPTEHIQELKDQGMVRWEEYTIKFIPGKMFKVKRRGTPEVTIYDVISFFRVSLLAACADYLSDDPDVDRIRLGKAARSVFTSADLYTLILPYWVDEGILMGRLMDSLRYALKGAGINLTHWHGPGAIANKLITDHKLGAHIYDSWETMPEQVKDASRYAYFAGRFDDRIIGDIPGPIHGYDLRSAYPAALSEMPGLLNGKWVNKQFSNERARYTVAVSERINEHALYRYRASAPDAPFGMFPHRSAGNTVSYGLNGDGWLYGVELKAAVMCGATVELLESWEWVYDTKEIPKPFWWLKEMYEKRAAYKRVGNPAHYGLKLGYNSAYGKLAQLVGFDPETFRPPKYHNAWYAGLTTAWCRARILLAIYQNADSVIAVETDGIYTRTPLELDLGEHLGQWDHEEYTHMIYVQSGLYFAEQDGEWHEAKARGLGNTVRSLTPWQATKCLRDMRSLHATVNRYGAFTGHLGQDTLHTWHTQPRELTWGGDGKRRHIPELCSGCHGETPWHIAEMTNPYPVGMSNPRELPWL